MSFKHKKISPILLTPKCSLPKTIEMADNIPLKHLLIQGDLFQAIPDLDCLPEPILSYETRGTIKPAILACEVDDGSQDRWILKEKKLAVHKVLWIFRLNSLISGHLSTNLVKLQKTLSSQGDIRIRRRVREQQVFNRPFRTYLRSVRLSFNSQQEHICNELRRIYRSMFRSGVSHWLIMKLHYRVSCLLSTAPNLIRIFKTFVPAKFHRTWKCCDRKLNIKKFASSLASQACFNFGVSLVPKSSQASGSGTSMAGGKHWDIRTEVQSIWPSIKR